ncbi:MAG: chemotaxis-specific protein-glutamate methyltransferase CheB [Promethearchaeota archaeon]
MSTLKNIKTDGSSFKKIKLLIAEDSSYQRKIISDMVSEHSQIEVIDVARNGYDAIEKIERSNPDVLLLDLIMPEMDGLTLYRYLSKHYPVPTIVFSALDPKEASKTLNDSIEALLLGAFDYIIKPSGIWKEEFPKFKETLINKVLLASEIKVKKELIKQKLKKKESPIKKPKKSFDGKDLSLQNILETPEITRKSVANGIIVMGASVGGPRTLKSILKTIPVNFSGSVLIVQHLNSFFMEQFAKSLDHLCKINVKIALNGEKIKPGQVYIAPGDKHMEIVLRENKPSIRIFDGEPVNFCKPSIDVLFFSAAKIFKKKTLAILLTGMGKDGVQGMGAIQKSGGVTISESEETAILYGMPKFAADYGFAEFISPNYCIKDFILRYSSRFSNS